MTNVKSQEARSSQAGMWGLLAASSFALAAAPSTAPSTAPAAGKEPIPQRIPATRPTSVNVQELNTAALVLQKKMVETPPAPTLELLASRSATQPSTQPAPDPLLQLHTLLRTPEVQEALKKVFEAEKIALPQALPESIPGPRQFTAVGAEYTAMLNSHPGFFLGSLQGVRLAETRGGELNKFTAYLHNPNVLRATALIEKRALIELQAKLVTHLQDVLKVSLVAEGDSKTPKAPKLDLIGVQYDTAKKKRVELMPESFKLQADIRGVDMTDFPVDLPAQYISDDMVTALHLKLGRIEVKFHASGGALFSGDRAGVDFSIVQTAAWQNLDPEGKPMGASKVFLTRTFSNTEQNADSYKEWKAFYNKNAESRIQTEVKTISFDNVYKSTYVHIDSPWGSPENFKAHWLTGIHPGVRYGSSKTEAGVDPKYKNGTTTVYEKPADRSTDGSLREAFKKFAYDQAVDLNPELRELIKDFLRRQELRALEQFFQKEDVKSALAQLQQMYTVFPLVIGSAWDGKFKGAAQEELSTQQLSADLLERGAILFGKTVKRDELCPAAYVVDKLGETLALVSFIADRTQAGGPLDLSPRRQVVIGLDALLVRLRAAEAFGERASIDHIRKLGGELAISNSAEKRELWRSALAATQTGNALPSLDPFQALRDSDLQAFDRRFLLEPGTAKALLFMSQFGATESSPAITTYAGVRDLDPGAVLFTLRGGTILPEIFPGVQIRPAAIDEALALAVKLGVVRPTAAIPTGLSDDQKRLLRDEVLLSGEIVKYFQSGALDTQLENYRRLYLQYEDARQKIAEVDLDETISQKERDARRTGLQKSLESNLKVLQAQLDQILIDEAWPKALTANLATYSEILSKNQKIKIKVQPELTYTPGGEFAGKTIKLPAEEVTITPTDLSAFRRMVALWYAMPAGIHPKSAEQGDLNSDFFSIRRVYSSGLDERIEIERKLNEVWDGSRSAPSGRGASRNEFTDRFAAAICVDIAGDLGSTSPYRPIVDAREVRFFISNENGTPRLNAKGLADLITTRLSSRRAGIDAPTLTKLSDEDREELSATVRALIRQGFDKFVSLIDPSR